MTLMISVLQLLIGFVLLMKGADFFVDGSSAIARRFNVPTLIIGMTIVAMGTSLPELSVSVVASMNGSNSLSVSNVTGSDLFNIMVALGACAIINNLKVTNDVLKRDFPIYILCCILLLVTGYSGMGLSRIDGVIFLIFFAFFMGIMVMSARNSDNSDDSPEEKKEISLVLSIIIIVGGGIAIKYGGDWVVEGATKIARAFGVTETLIGLTIVAFGTSLPEFVTSMVAAKKNEVDMAIGNVIGSNIFNILLILGVASVLSPISLLKENITDLVILLSVSVIVFIFSMSRRTINRVEGMIMVALYGLYMAYIITR